MSQAISTQPNLGCGRTNTPMANAECEGQRILSSFQAREGGMSHYRLGAMDLSVSGAFVGRCCPG